MQLNMSKISYVLSIKFQLVSLVTENFWYGVATYSSFFCLFRLVLSGFLVLFKMFIDWDKMLSFYSSPSDVGSRQMG